MKSEILQRIFIIFSLTALLLSCRTNSENSSTNFVEGKNESIPIKEKKSVFNTLEENRHLAIEELISFYYQLKAEHQDDYNFENEQELNQLGYSFIQENKIKSAIEIFKLLVSEFPEAANPYDSLGEAYLKDGNEELALLNYEKSIQINPNNHHAIDQVTILKGLELLVTDWGKEFFHFPLHFAEEIPYQGVEEVVFPKNWIKPDSTDFWSYVFVWALDDKKDVTAKELESNLELYFDGLMGGLERADKSKLTKSFVNIENNTNPSDSVTFIGTLNIFDGFATQKPLTLNARIQRKHCSVKNQLILLFQFSPLAYDQPIWEKLRTVKTRSSICEK